MTTFTFTDRSSWLAWRADWRLSYREATETIRKTKRDLAALHAARRAGTTDAEREKIDQRASYAQSDLAGQRKEAAYLMVDRTEADKHRKALLAQRDQIAA